MKKVFELIFLSKFLEMSSDDSLTSNQSLEDKRPEDHVIFETLEGRVFNVEVNVVKKFSILKTMLEDSVANKPVKLTQISGQAFEKMIEFASKFIVINF